MDIQDQKGRLQGQLRNRFGRHFEITTLSDDLVVYDRADKRQAHGSYEMIRQIAAGASDEESFWRECEAAGLLCPPQQ